MIHLLSFETPFCVQSTQNSTYLHGFKQWRITDRMPEPVFVNDYRAQESIPPTYVAWRAGTTNGVAVRAARLGIDSWDP
jgi:hypothetical protein